MSPFAKILLLLVAAFAAYVLWPRTPDLNRISPAQAAKHEAAAWKALQEGKTWTAVKEYYLLFDRDFGFSPARAFVLAQQACREQKNVLSTSDALLQETSIQRFIEHYAIFKRDLGSEMDSAAAGRNEFNSWVMVEAQDFGKGLEIELGRLYSQVFGADPESLAEAVKERVKALREAFAKGEREVDWASVRAGLRTFYENLPLGKGTEPSATAQP